MASSRCRGPQIEIIPPTSTATPLIAKYLIFTMVMVTLSVMFTTFVLSIHHQGVRPMPALVRVLFIDVLGSALLVYRKPSQCLPDRGRRDRKMPAGGEAFRFLEDHFGKMSKRKNVIHCSTISYPAVITVNE